MYVILIAEQLNYTLEFGNISTTNVNLQLKAKFSTTAHLTREWTDVISAGERIVVCQT